ncbi:MAG: serine protease Do [Rubritalea sp.]|jgi:serine protease Do
MQKHSRKNIPQSPYRTLRRVIACSLGITLASIAAAQQSVAAAPIAEPERPYFNDKKVPDAKDLKAIQKLLQLNKNKARAATVCIQLGEGSGSGVIVSEDGLVLTAAHVSAGVNKEVTVVMEDGKKLKALTLGLHSETDAAMIQITEKGSYPFVDIDPGKEQNTVSTKLGDWVFALGHSGGFDKERGSGLRLGRLVRIADTTVQTDCTLIGGDSGGPLFDMNGVLVGIHSRVGKVTEENMHVPVHVFHTHWDAMKKGDFIGQGPFAKKPVKGSGFIGIALEKAENGLKVTDVDEDSAAGKAGVKIGDILTKVEGKSITEKKELIAVMKVKAAGDDINITVLREGKSRELKLNLGAR